MAYGRDAVVDVRGQTELRQYFTNILATMSVGLALTGAIAYYISHDATMMNTLFHLVPGVNSHGEPTQVPQVSAWWWTAAAVELGLVLMISTFGVFKSGLPGSVSFLLFGVFAAANGVTLAPVLYAYTDASVAQVALITAITFGGAALWGKTTKMNLRPMGTFFLIALIGLLVTLVVSMFFHSPLMDMIISGVAVLLFAGLTAYDMQRLEDLYDASSENGGPVAYGALVLYLDALNLFIHLLRLFGSRK